MKKCAFLFALIFVLSLVACAPKQKLPDLSQGPVVDTVGEFQFCLLGSPTAQEKTYYAFAENQKKAYTQGDAFSDPEAKRSKTAELFGSSYPVYYSVTTRPAGYTKEVDVYVSSDSSVAVEYLRGTDTSIVASFTANYPKIEGEVTEEKVVAAAKSFLPDGVFEDTWDVYYNEEVGMHQVILTAVVDGIATAEYVEMLVDTEGQVLEIRWWQPGTAEALKDVKYDKAAMEVLFDSAVRAAYKNGEKNAVKQVEVASITLNVDLDGTYYYAVVLTVEYESAQADLPAVLDLLFYPIEA